MLGAGSDTPCARPKAASSELAGVVHLNLGNLASHRVMTAERINILILTNFGNKQIKVQVHVFVLFEQLFVMLFLSNFVARKCKPNNNSKLKATVFSTH